MLQAVLKVIGGKQDGNLIPLTTKKFLIGREQDCHLRPGSESVSRHHCAINVDDFGVRIRDLGSSNGTLVNGTRIIGAQEIRTGDQIKIGSLEFELCVTSEGVPVEVSQGESGTEFSLNDFELDAANDTAVMSGDTAVIDTRKSEEPVEAASEAEATEPPLEVPAPQAEPQPVAAEEQPQPAAHQPAADPATAPLNPQAVPQPEMQPPGMPQPGMPYPPQQMPGYPGMPQPGYPYGMPPQPAYGMPGQPQYGMPYPQQPGYPPQPMGYPPQQPGYPPQPMGYPPQQMGYPPQQPGYPPQQQMPYPAQPAPTPMVEDDYEDEYDDDDAASSSSGPPVSLPDPAETGAKDEPKPQGTDGKPAAAAPNPAEEVLKKYTNRR